MSQLESKQNIINLYSKLYDKLIFHESVRDYHLKNLRYAFEFKDDYYLAAYGIVKDHSLLVIKYRQAITKLEALILK